MCHRLLSSHNCCGSLMWKIHSYTFSCISMPFWLCFAAMRKRNTYENITIANWEEFKIDFHLALLMRWIPGFLCTIFSHTWLNIYIEYVLCTSHSMNFHHHFPFPYFILQEYTLTSDLIGCVVSRTQSLHKKKKRYDANIQNKLFWTQPTVSLAQSKWCSYILRKKCFVFIQRWFKHTINFFLIVTRHSMRKSNQTFAARHIFNIRYHTSTTK